LDDAEKERKEKKLAAVGYLGGWMVRRFPFSRRGELELQEKHTILEEAIDLVKDKQEQVPMLFPIGMWYKRTSA
jgi:hypothetical protein